MRLPSDSLTALARSENLIGRLYMQMPANTCLPARRNSWPARMLRQTAYQEFCPTSADFLRRQNQDCRQSGASNPFVVASVNTQRKKYALRLLGEKGRAPGSSARVAHIWRSRPHRTGLPPSTKARGPANSFKTAFSFQKEQCKFSILKYFSATKE